MFRRAAIVLAFALAVGTRSVAAQSPESPVLLSEYLADPAEAGSDNQFEWVEIQNTSMERVDLSGWTIADERLSDSLAGLVIEPGAFVVIAGKEATFDATVTVYRVKDGAIGGGLNNTGDTIKLVDPSGAVVDSVAYGDTRDVLLPVPGITTARTSEGTWRLSKEPTPGGENAFVAESDFAAAYPIPIEYRIADDGTDKIAWVFLGACAGAGIGGAAMLLLRYGKARRTGGR